jgi:hypothetical protein
VRVLRSLRRQFDLLVVATVVSALAGWGAIAYWSNQAFPIDVAITSIVSIASLVIGYRINERSSERRERKDDAVRIADIESARIEKLQEAIVFTVNSLAIYQFEASPPFMTILIRTIRSQHEAQIDASKILASNASLIAVMTTRISHPEIRRLSTELREFMVAMVEHNQLARKDIKTYVFKANLAIERIGEILRNELRA